MKHYRSLKEMVHDFTCADEVYLEVKNIVFTCEEMSIASLCPGEVYQKDDNTDLTTEPFVNLFGGDFFLLETEEDLHHIFTQVENESTGNFSDITEVATTFDEARYTASGNFAVFASFTNNDGGPTWYIPRVIADTCPNIKKSIILSNDGEIAQYSID
jgi:hypothetical protein